MSELKFHFEISNDADRNQVAEIARVIELRAKQELEAVEEVVAKPEAPRFGAAEALAFIAVTVVVSRGGRALAEEFRQWIPTIEAWIREIRGLKNVWLNVDGKAVSIGKLSDDDRKKIADKASESC